MSESLDRAADRAWRHAAARHAASPPPALKAEICRAARRHIAPRIVRRRLWWGGAAALLGVAIVSLTLLSHRPEPSASELEAGWEWRGFETSVRQLAAQAQEIRL